MRLEKTFNPAKLTIHSGDALKFDFAQIPVPAGQKLRIVLQQQLRQLAQAGLQAHAAS